MTTYFDTLDTALRDISPEADDAWEALSALDERVVRDVSIAVMLPSVPAANGRERRPTCPPGYATAVHKTILAHSLAGCGSAGPDYADAAAYRVGIARMGHELHSIFHELARLDDWHYGDGPLASLRALEDDAADARQALAVASTGGAL